MLRCAWHRAGGAAATDSAIQPSPEASTPLGQASSHPSALGLSLAPSSDLANSILHQGGGNQCKSKAGLMAPLLKMSLWLPCGLNKIELLATCTSAAGSGPAHQSHLVPPDSLPPWSFLASWQAYSSPGAFALAASLTGWSSLLLQVSAGMGTGLQLSHLIGGCPTPSLSSRRSL